MLSLSIISASGEVIKVPINVFLFISGGEKGENLLCLFLKKVYVSVCVGGWWGGVAGRDVTRKRSPNRETNVVTSKYWVILDTGEGKRAVQYPFYIAF